MKINGNDECSQIALLSQEGSVIAFFAMTRVGGSPSEIFQNAFLMITALEPPPARSRLLTQEGSSAGVQALIYRGRWLLDQMDVNLFFRDDFSVKEGLDRISSRSFKRDVRKKADVIRVTI